MSVDCPANFPLNRICLCEGGLLDGLADSRSVILIGIALAVASCGKQDGSSTSSVYRKLTWYDSHEVSRIFSEDVRAMVASAVVLARKKHTFGETGFCSGGFAAYTDHNGRVHNLAITAGHCLLNLEHCDKTFFVPNYENYELLGEERRRKFTIYKCSKLLAREVEPFPLNFKPLQIEESLIASGHPSNLDDETVEEINDKPEINWDDLAYLNAGYIFGKKTVSECSTFVVSNEVLTHDCDTRRGFSGALLYTYPDLAFAGIHFHGGKHFEPGEKINPDELNRAISPEVIKAKLQELTSGEM